MPKAKRERGRRKERKGATPAGRPSKRASSKLNIEKPTEGRGAATRASEPSGAGEELAEERETESEKENAIKVKSRKGNKDKDREPKGGNKRGGGRERTRVPQESGPSPEGPRRR